MSIYSEFQLHKEFQEFKIHEETCAILSQDEMELVLQDPSSIVQIYDNLKEYIHLGLNDACIFKLVEFICNGTDVYINIIAFNAQIKSIKADLFENAAHNFELDKLTLEMYVIVWYSIINLFEKKISSDKSSSKAPSAKIPKQKKSAVDSVISNRLLMLQTIECALNLDISRIIIQSSEYECLVSIIVNAISLLLETPEVIKDESVKSSIIDILCLCVSHHEKGPRSAIQIRVIREYLREEHMSDFVSDFLETAVNLHDGLPFFENVMRELSEQMYMSDDPKPAKVFAKFITRLTDSLPIQMLKQMANLKSQIDSDSYSVRCAMIEVIGTLVQKALPLNASENNENLEKNLYSFYDILMDRFRDTSSFVRAKLLNVLKELAERHPNQMVSSIPVSLQQKILSFAIGRLKDKNSNVRKSAVKFITKMIESSPFMAFAQDDGKLSLKYFQSKKNNLEDLIKLKSPFEHFKTDNEGHISNNDAQEDVQMSDAENIENDMDETKDTKESPSNDTDQTDVHSNVVSPATEIELRHLKGLLKYYTDGIRFILQIESAVPNLIALMASSTKGEVVDAMNFFVIAHRYEMECAESGVRYMIHKIWEKDTGDSEIGSIRDHLIKCYMSIYMDPPPSNNRTPQEVIAENLIKLTVTMNLAELTSLDHLLNTMISKDKFEMVVVDVLWSIFVSKKKEVSKSWRRGSLMILSMLAKSKKEIISDNFDVLLHNGLGEFAKDDLFLAKHTCIALQQLASIKREKGSMVAPIARFPASHIVFERLTDLILESSDSPHWYGFAEQAINSIYECSEKPDSLCGVILKSYTAMVFEHEKCQSDSIKEDTDAIANLNIDRSDEVLNKSQSDLKNNHAEMLSKLCFLVGHVAMKEIVHLEAIESEWKRRKHLENGIKEAKKSSDDLDQVTGTAEDEFSDKIMHIRERELLYGEKSLLGVYGPLISYICTNNRSFNDSRLQNMAVIALCKFMCISGDFCDSHLQLLFTILEKTADPVVKSNIVIGLGDMAICFNSLIDQNISYLYNRLTDNDMNVKKNALMVLTFLILNGMIKVKGQISEMAKCLEDSDQRISDLAKLFFTELATKDNAVYNNLPDVISNLSHPTNGVNEETFQKIMKFLLDFIKKDKQTDSIADKLLQRFRNADTERQWRDIVFCLSLLSFNSEKSIKKLEEHLPLYHEKLYEQSARKIPGKSDLKAYVDQFEEKLIACREKSLENYQATSKAQKETQNPNSQKILANSNIVNVATDALASLTIEPKSEIPKKPAKKTKSTAVSRRKKQVKSDDEGDENIDSEENEPVEYFENSTKKNAKSLNIQTPIANHKQVFKNSTMKKVGTRTSRRKVISDEED